MKPINLREADFKKEVQGFSFPQSVKDEFISYWTEPNKSGTKMRFEMEKTWHLGRRMARWANNGFGGVVKSVTHKPTPVKKEPENEQERVLQELDRRLEVYREHPADVKFEEFGKLYDQMKEMKLLKPFTKGEVENLKTVYKNDNSKCRCAAVQETFNYYGVRGISFSDVLRVRNL